MKEIPVIKMEEHHEAFWIWHYAISQNWIPSSRNTLLHIDEHSDMGVPRFNHSLKAINGDLSKIYDFTYNELTIENFIIPAIYQGLFNKVFWIRQSREASLPESMCVYAMDKEAKILMAKNAKELGPGIIFNPQYKLAKYQCLTIEDDFKKGQTVILDVDLDYFSCNHNYYNFRGKIEITEEQYLSFETNPHQFLKMTLGSGVKSQRENGKYYLLFNEYEQTEAIPNRLKVSEEEILQRIDRVVEFLQKHEVKIQLIDICRSRLSGFTPEDQYQFIEDNLLKKIGEVYNLNFVSLPKIPEKIAV